MGRFLSDDELISAINHSSAPYVIVEGKDDVMIYRWILDDIGYAALLEPRNGCDGVRKIYDRRSEIINPRVVYLCDRDTNVYAKRTPSKYRGIIYTKGYSIENDIYYGRALERKLFEKIDSELFEKALSSFIRYYACELEKMRECKIYDFHKKPEAIINNKDFSLRESLLSDFHEPSSDTIQYLKNDYDLLLRGHSLFKLVRMILHRKNRNIKYEEKELYEICYKFCKSKCVLNLQRKIKKSLAS